MKIELETNDLDEQCSCHLCGEVFFASEVVARAYKESGEYLTDVCLNCLAAGADGISLRMRERAEYLRQIACELDRLSHSEIKAPNLVQFRVMTQIANALR